MIKKILIIKLLIITYCVSYAQLSFERHDLGLHLDGIESIHSADYDGDGDNDFFTASRNDNRVTLFESIWNGFFLSTRLTTTLKGASVVKSFDLDIDGDIDVIASGSHPGNHSIYWWENIT